MVPSGLRAAKALSFTPWAPLLRVWMVEYWPGRWLGSVLSLTMIVKVWTATPLVSLAAKVNW